MISYNYYFTNFRLLLLKSVTQFKERVTRFTDYPWIYSC